MAALEPGDVHIQFFEAFKAKDVEALVNLYEPDALLMIPGSPIAGIDAIRQGMEMGVESGLSFEHESLVAHQSGDIAVLDCKTMVTETAADGTVNSYSSTSIEIVRRQADGTWRFVIDLPGR